jgi:hypothetical protein
VSGGSDNGGGDDADLAFTFQDGSGNVAINLQRRGGAVVAMALSPFASTIGTPGVPFTPLTVEDASVASSFTLRNLQSDTLFEHVAEVDNGNVLVVTEPTEDPFEQFFRLFYGAPGAILERRIVSAARTLGGATNIVFDVNGAELEARFTRVTKSFDGGFENLYGPGTLDVGDGTSVGFTEPGVDPKPPSGSRFTCF